MAEGSALLWRVLGQLNDEAKKVRSGWEARCPGPAHRRGDKHASLSIGIGDDGRVLLRCHAGCSTPDILQAIGLDWDDLFERSRDKNRLRRFKAIDRNGKVVAEHLREELPGGDKRIWWEAGGKNGLNGINLTELPLYRAHDVLADEQARPVVLVEGEKAGESLAEKGVLVVATMTGADQAPSAAVLSALLGHEVWLWPDNDPPGRTHMQAIAHVLEQIGVGYRWINWPSAPDKGDAADYVASGGDVNLIGALLSPAATAEPARKQSTRIWSANELASAHFPSVQWAIPGILPAGLTILAGRPKLGKSWLMLGWALAIAGGWPALRQIDVEQGEVLYLALEDNERRLQERIALLLGEREAPHALHLVTQWPRLDEGGTEQLLDWIDRHPRARFIGIDTFKRVRPREQARSTQRMYDLDYDAITPAAAMAAERNLAISGVFHTNKSDPEDPIDLVSGTLGLSAAADAILVLKRERGKADASLFVTGRDVEEQDLALKWERDDVLGWELLGKATDFRLSRERSQIVEVVTMAPGMKPADIAAATGMKPGNVRRLLFSMARDGDVRNRSGGYFPGLVTDAPSRARAIPSNGNASFSAPSQKERYRPITDPPSPLQPPITPTTPIPSIPTNTPVTDKSTDMHYCVHCMRNLPSDEYEAHEPCPEKVNLKPQVVEELCPVHHMKFDAHDCDQL